MTSVKTCTTCRFAVLAGYDALFCEAPQNAVAPGRTELAVGRPPLDRGWRWPSCNTHRSSGFIAALVLGRCGEAGRWWTKLPNPPPALRVLPVARRSRSGVPENEPCKPSCPAEIAAARAMDPAP